MPIPAVITASLPILRYAGVAAVTATTWTVCAYASDRIIRKMDKNAFGGASKADASPDQRRNAVQASMLLALQEQRGHRTLSQALKDPLIVAALEAVEAAQSGPATAPQEVRKAA